MPDRAPLAFPGASRRAVPERIAPGTAAEIGILNAGITMVLGRIAGGPAPAVFTTFARHRRIFRPWLRFAARLMPFGTLARRECELVILRVAVLTGSEYEWSQHVRLAADAGVTAGEIATVGEGPDAPSWNARDRALLRATDELVGEHRVGRSTWDELLQQLDERERIELCFLVGNYVMVAGALNSFGVVPDGPPAAAKGGPAIPHTPAGWP